MPDDFGNIDSEVRRRILINDLRNFSSKTFDKAKRTVACMSCGRKMFGWKPCDCSFVDVRINIGGSEYTFVPDGTLFGIDEREE